MYLCTHHPISPNLTVVPPSPPSLPSPPPPPPSPAVSLLRRLLPPGPSFLQNFFRSRAKSERPFLVPLKENDRPFSITSGRFTSSPPPPPPLLHLPFSFSQLTSANLATIVIISHQHTYLLSDVRSLFLFGHWPSTSPHVRLATLATTTPFFLSIATASQTPHHPPAGRDHRHVTSALLCSRSLLSRLTEGKFPRLPPPQFRGDRRLLPLRSPAPCNGRPTSTRLDHAPNRPPESRPPRDKRWRKRVPRLTAPESSRLDIVLSAHLEFRRRTRPASTNSRQLAAYPTTTLRTRDHHRRLRRASRPLECPRVRPP